MMASIFELAGRLIEDSPSWILAFDVESGVLNAKADVETKSAAIIVKIFIFSPELLDVLFSPKTTRCLGRLGISEGLEKLSLGDVS